MHSNSLFISDCDTLNLYTSVPFSWVLYVGENFTGNMCVLSEGDYPNLTSMGIPTDSGIRSVKAVPMVRRNCFLTKYMSGKEVDKLSNEKPIDKRFYYIYM